MTLEEYYSKRKNYKIGGARLRHILNILPSTPRTILDVGCGAGDLASVLSAKGYIVDGLDISPEAIKEASQHIRNGYCVDLSVGDLPQELSEARYDIIIVSEVLEHTFAPEDVLGRIRPLLNDNGIAIITVPNFLFWKTRLQILLGKFQYEFDGLLDFGHIRFFTHTYAREVFAKTKFQISKEDHFYPNLEHRHMTWLGNLFPSFFAYQFIFLLKK